MIDPDDVRFNNGFGSQDLFTSSGEPESQRTKDPNYVTESEQSGMCDKCLVNCLLSFDYESINYIDFICFVQSILF